MAGFLSFWYFYVIPFLLLFVLIRWYLFVPGALLALGLTVWMWRDLKHADGPGGVFAIIIVVVIAGGFLAGGLARATLLIAGRRWSGPLANAIVGLAFLIGIPLGYHAWTQSIFDAEQKRREPPSLACRSRLFDATMAGTPVRLPLVPGLHVGEGAEFSPYYAFELPEYARRFCAYAWDKVPALTNLSVDFARGVEKDPKRRQTPICERQRPEAWWPWLCRADRAKPPLVETLNLFDADRYKASKMLAWDADRGKYFAKYVPQARWVQGQRFDTFGGTEYRALNWKRAATPYYATCFDSADGGRYCRAGYRLTPRLGIVYGFRSSAGSFDKDAVAADAAAQALAMSFLTTSK